MLRDDLFNLDTETEEAKIRLEEIRILQRKVVGAIDNLDEYIAWLYQVRQEDRERYEKRNAETEARNEGMSIADRLPDDQKQILTGLLRKQRDGKKMVADGGTPVDLPSSETGVKEPDTLESEEEEDLPKAAGAA